MIKRYLLFLLFLCCAIGSVNATAVTIPETCATTDYYVELIENMDTYTTKAILATYSYDSTVPEISGVNGNCIYFPDVSSLARFCNIFSGTSPSVAFGGEFDVYKSGVRTDTTTLFLSFKPTADGTYYGNMSINVSSSQLAYVYYDYDGGYVYNKAWYYYQGAQLYYFEDPASRYSSLALVPSGVFSMTNARSQYDNSMYASFVIFDYVEYEAYDENSYMVASTVMGPPERGSVSIYTEPGTEIYEDSYLWGTTDNGGLLEIQLPLGERTLKFVKDGYWDLLKTITVSENNTDVFVTMAPSNAIFQVEKEFSGDIYPNSIARLSLDVTPVKTAYATKLRVSGVEVNKVYYNTQELPKAADGSYIIGDISSPQNIVIDFKTTSSWGERTFTVELSATDIEGTAYTNLETINYNVLELPFLFEAPDSWAIGTNEVTLTDMSGESYSVLLVLYDKSGTEKWSSSTNLLEYCEYTFEVPIEDAGEYILELNAKSGSVKSYYSVEIIEPVSLVSDFLTANPGKVATVQFKISNPTESVKYYKASLSCPFYNDTIDKTFSIAPGTVDKTVDMSFEVPEDLEMEYYQLTLEVFDEGKTDPIYSGHVVLTISNASLLIASVPGGNTTLIILAAALILIVGTFAALRLKK
ncbi:hypothetical protein [Methanococcus maripaludis]|uniref:PEGA domain-containing protein n=1 Tax=Methanococcus maripaludis TaxID=39152 RepID=A0A8T4CIE9_METMI|nr:hypothetical protein [Methanococcus maripaludis]MBM7408430.1 hypothetical protein [Methanococcus maripaludis]MBP2220262.1 hypothetical protein [Methanococcus maripaludis]